MRLPHPLILLVGCVLLAAGLSWVLPAGEFERRDDPVTGRQVVVANTYHQVERTPVGAFDAVVAIPRGMADAAGVIFYVFLVGGAFAVVERTGASTRLVSRLVASLEGKEGMVIPITCLAFGAGGALIQMQEELIAFVPMLLLLTGRLGYSPVVAVAVSMGASSVAAAFSPWNPFQVIIAQKVAELGIYSGLGFRLAFLALAVGVWIWGVMRYARKTRVAPQAPAGGGSAMTLSTWRDGAILCTIVATFALFIYGAKAWGWDFDQYAALFFLMGVVVGVLGRLGAAGTAEAFVTGFGSLAYAALLIGFARGIYVVLTQGHIVDTLVHALFVPISTLPVTLAALGMMAVQALIHVPVPSTSGQAVLTMPVLVPLSDLLGLSRQVTVLAYQYGAGLCELVTPTNGGLMAMLAATGVRYDQWMRLLGKVLLALVLLAAVGLVTGIAAHLR